MAHEGDTHPVENAVAGLERTVRAMRARDVSTEGVPTFLLLEEDAGTASPGTEAAEDRVLAGMAGGILDRLSGAGDASSAADAVDAQGASSAHERNKYPSLREKVPLTLEALAAVRFATRFAPEKLEPAAPATPRPRDARGHAGGDRAGGRDWSAARVRAAFEEGRYVRAVNFHATPRRFAGRMEAQLSWLAERFAPVGQGDLLALADGHAWPHAKPPLILSFFDGRRDNFEVAAPALEKLGLIGWFFVVSGWVAAPPEEQYDFARRSRVSRVGQPDPRETDPRETDGDHRLAMTPEEIGSLADNGHAVASHTRLHATIRPGMPEEEIEGEVVASKRHLEQPLGGRAVRALVWRGGSSLGIDAGADRAMRQAGYELLFANHVVQRVR